MSILSLHPGNQKNVECFYDYQVHSGLNSSENKPQMNADEHRFIASGSEACLSNFGSILLEFYSKNKPQINADERRFIAAGSEAFLLNFGSILHEFYLKNKPCNASKSKLLNKSKDEPCLSILNSTLSHHIFNRTYSSLNHCN